MKPAPETDAAGSTRRQPEITPAARAGASGVEPSRSAPAGVVIDRATAADVSVIGALLREAGLPDDDFAPHIGTFVVARAGGRVVGAVGCELQGTDALLRSLVVAPDARGTGLGTRLLEALDAAAAAWGVQRWWLLTTTAEGFFAARGFVVVPRSSAPPAIQGTGQFSGGICRSATCLSRKRGVA